MTSTLRLLHLEDSPQDAELIHSILEEEGLKCDMVQVKSRVEFEKAVVQGKFDLILSDFALPGYDGLTALAMVRRIHPQLPFILVSGTVGEDGAIDSLKSGATDYVLKTRLVRLVPAVRRALKEAAAVVEHKKIEDLFHRIMENLEDLVTVMDLSGKRVFCSPSYHSLFENPHLLVGTDAFGEVFEEDRERVRRMFVTSSATGLAQRLEYRIVLRDGGLRYLESQITAMRGDDGRVANILMVSRDVTSRKEAEERILEQAALLDKAQDAICVNDLSQQILYWNKSAERLYGWSAAEAIGKNANDLLFHGDLDHPLKALRELMRSGEWQGELYQADRNGRELIIESRWTLMRDARGQPKSILVINTDVTDKKQTEAKFLRTQRMESIGALAGGIAHDLNNALAPILLASEFLENELTTPVGHKMLSTMKLSAQRGSEMVKQILSFARGVSGEHTTLDLSHLISDMEVFIRSTFPRSIRIQTQIEKDLCLVLGDPTQIHQVLLNLSVNARDAMPDGGLLTIEAANVPDGKIGARRQIAGPHVMLAVTDTGNGISPDLIEKIFEPFFTTKAFGKGTGLGLSTVMSIVKTHSGFVEVSSEVKKGTTFRVFLPSASERVEKTESVKAPPPLIPEPRSGMILMVDDDMAILQMTKLNLEAYDFSVLATNDGLEAIELYQQHQEQIKVVLTDLRMPSMDGLTLITRLRAINPQVKIIGISGHDADDEEVRSVRPLLSAFLNKPFSTESLLKTLRTAFAVRN